METDFLRRIYWAASGECSCPTKGNRLNELYSHIPDVSAATDSLYKQTGQLGMNLDSISAELSDLVNAYEMQGFLNGFRLGALLSGELWETGRSTADRPAP